jgi:RNA polymerase sigma-70 factor (ECF subfamily)
MAEREDPVGQLLDRVVRDEYPRILAAVARSVGDLDLAEDAVQDAIGAAIASWARSGPPDVPAAWLTTAARRRAIDVLRREGRRGELEARTAPIADHSDTADGGGGDVVPTGPMVDDQLRLMFVTCHPSLTPDTQVTLTLRFVAGLRTDEIARLLLVEPDTVTKRIRRARNKMRDARILLRLPPPERLAERVHPVLDCLYLVFTEGYAATDGDALVRVDLCSEAIRLTRLVAELDPDNPEPRALLALQLLQHSRAATRVDGQGRPVLLADQDRSRWDRACIDEAQQLLASMQSTRELSRYAAAHLLQARIAAVHAGAPSWERTDWAAIRVAYDELHTLTGSPVVGLNRVVAISMADGPAAALVAFEQLEPDDTLERSHQWHLVHADLCERLGKQDAAAGSYRRALELARTTPEREHIAERLAAVASGSTT